MTTENIPQEIRDNPEAVAALLAAVFGDEPGLETVGDIKAMIARDFGSPPSTPEGSHP